MEEQLLAAAVMVLASAEVLAVEPEVLGRLALVLTPSAAARLGVGSASSPTAPATAEQLPGIVADGVRQRG